MTTTYNLNGKTTQDIAMIVRNYLEMNEGMESQTFATPEGGAVIQARSRGGSFKQFVGLDKAITVKINPISETHVSVDIGEGKWVDKGIAMTVSWFVLGPLLLHPVSACTSSPSSLRRSTALSPRTSATVSDKIDRKVK